MNILPDGWDLAQLSEVQLLFVKHWTQRKKDDDWRTWGEMLGVYWTSDKFGSATENSKGNTTKSNAKRRKVVLPLAALLAPEVLNKTLDRVLDKSPEPPKDGSSTGLAKTVDGHYSLDSMPLDKYRELFNFAVDETNKSDPETSADKAIAPSAKLNADGLIETDAFNVPKIDIDKLAKFDPELAKHLSADYSW